MTRWQAPDPRPGRDELNDRLESAGVEPGETWQHVASGDRYFVAAVALLEDDHSIVVVYQPSDGEGPVWVRPADEFTKRFRLVH